MIEGCANARLMLLLEFAADKLRNSPLSNDELGCDGTARVGFEFANSEKIATLRCRAVTDNGDIAAGFDIAWDMDNGTWCTDYVKDIRA